MPETQIFMITNFHLAIQDEGSLKRLNFSRNIMENLGKNFIFLTTQYGDDILSANAYDFYSYIKLCITFQNYETIFASKKEANYTFHKVQEVLAINQWSPENYKQKLKETDVLIEQANDPTNNVQYYENEKLLLNELKTMKTLLGAKHLEIAKINLKLAEIYKHQVKYKEAEALYNKSLHILQLNFT